MRRWVPVPGLVPPLEVLRWAVSQGSPKQSNESYATWSLDRDRFCVRNIGEFDNLFWSSLKSLGMCQREYYDNDQRGNLPTGLEVV